MIDDELVVGSGSALENDQVSCDMLVHGAEVSNSDTESEMDHEHVVLSLPVMMCSLYSPYNVILVMLYIMI